MPPDSEAPSGKAPRLHEEFRPHTVQSCYLDNLLPEELALEIVEAFPDKSTMTLKKSLRENKYVVAQMNQYAPILEDIVYAFQDLGVLKTVEKITGIRDMGRMTACTPVAST